MKATNRETVQAPAALAALQISLKSAADWSKAQDAVLDGLEIESTPKIRSGVALLDLSLELYGAICHLIDAGMYAAAFALYRSLFEAYVRGVWLSRCASDADVKRFNRDKVPPIDLLIAAIEKLPGFSSGSLAAFKKDAWNNLNGFTHGGSVQANARLSATEVVSLIQHNHADSLLVPCSAISLLASVAIVEAAGAAGLAPDLYLAFKKAFVGS